MGFSLWDSTEEKEYFFDQIIEAFEEFLRMKNVKIKNSDRDRDGLGDYPVLYGPDIDILKNSIEREFNDFFGKQEY